MKIVKRIIAVILAIILAACATSAFVILGLFISYNSTTDKQGLILKYDKPAVSKEEIVAWNDKSLPMGNGYCGINVLGRTEKDKVYVTDNTLVKVNQDEKSIINTGGYRDSVIPFSILNFDFGHTKNSKYLRTLDLNTGVSTVEYTSNGVKYEREYFVSYPDKCIVIKIKADKENALNFKLSPEIPYLDAGYRKGNVVKEDDMLRVKGVVSPYGLMYDSRIKIVADGTANVENADDNAYYDVKDSTEALIIMTLGTNYQLESETFLKETDKLQGAADPNETVLQEINDALKMDYNTLKQRHIDDFKSVLGTSGVDIGGSFIPKQTTDYLMRYYTMFNTSASARYLETLVYNFGRYLLFSSSRPGTMPSNLQGTWVGNDKPAWNAGYWHNINVQMNYWSVFNTNIGECFDAYYDYFSAIYPKLQKHADNYIKANYPDKFTTDGDNGWIIGTMGLRFEVQGIENNPENHSGAGTAGLTAMMFWDWYEYTKDIEVLKKIYPVLEGLSNFYSKIVIEKDGLYLMEHSASPEILVEKDGENTPYHTTGSAFDQQMIYSVYKATLKAQEILNKEDTKTTLDIKKQIDKLDPVIIGESGQIKEFREETTYGSIGDPHHRHISHLLGLYPGNVINNNTPEWLEGAKVTLKNRGPHKSVGWAEAHRSLLWARVNDGKNAFASYRRLIQYNLSDNLWGQHAGSPHSLFQIDANMGATASFVEMLMQSESGFIEILPAISTKWKTGSFNGLVARGNFVVGAIWKDNIVNEVSITSNVGGTCDLSSSNLNITKVLDKDGNSVSFTNENGIISFETQQGNSYTIKCN